MGYVIGLNRRRRGFGSGPVTLVVKEHDSAVVQTLMVAYYNKARDELVQRMVQRDAALALFLAAAATIFGVVIHDLPRSASLLFSVPLLGFGASSVHAQHTGIMGRLGKYLAVEFDRDVKELLGIDRPPTHWDTSEALLNAHGLVALRLAAGTVMLVLPEIAALAAGTWLSPVSPLTVSAFVAGLLAIIGTAMIELWSYRHRITIFDDMRRAVHAQRAGHGLP
jgi:hypothetical protein